MILRNLMSMSVVNVVRSALQFVLTMMMIAFITPADYGLVTFSIPFTAFIALITDFGMSSAMIQRKTLDGHEAGAAVTLMGTAGLLCAVALSACAVPLAAFVQMKGLAPVLVAMSASVFLSIVAVGTRAIFERRLQYGIIARMELLAVGCGAIFCVVGAFAGWGVWALVGNAVIAQGVRAIGFAYLVRRDVRLNFAWGTVASILSFGGWVLGANVLNFVARNVDNVLVGAVLGSAAVGLYGVAYQFLCLPLIVLAWPASGVLLSTLSRMAATDATASSRTLVRAMLVMTTMVVFPAMIYLTFGLRYPFQALAPEHWLAAEPLIAVLAPAGAMQALSTYLGAVQLARGETRRQFYVSAINSAVMVAAFVAGLPFGLPVMVLTYAAVSSLTAVVFVGMLGHMVDIRVGDLWTSLSRAALGSALALGATMLATGGRVDTLGAWIVATLVYVFVVLATYTVQAKTVRTNMATLLGPRLPRAASGPEVAGMP